MSLDYLLPMSPVYTDYPFGRLLANFINLNYNFSGISVSLDYDRVCAFSDRDQQAGVFAPINETKGTYIRSCATNSIFHELDG